MLAHFDSIDVNRHPSHQAFPEAVPDGNLHTSPLQALTPASSMPYKRS